ncbi:MAG: radical SAM protein [Lachnospiraceae bacterium]|nr:radical SAM protein [Lachnospiraceae bacterium]
MNKYIKNLNRIEFVVTLACTGKCKHCSEGEHTGFSEHIDGDVAAQAVRKLAGQYKLDSLMTFGGEPLLYPDAVCKIHSAVKEMNIPKRQLITNGFFSKDEKVIRDVATRLADSGVNNLLLSVDAFHQETIPVEPVLTFAKAVKATGVPIRLNPAWLVSEDADNPYNRRTKELIKIFEDIGIEVAEGNVIFPSGNALKFLKEYFDQDKEYLNPYEENPEDVRAISVEPNGDVLQGNIYREDILDIIEEYKPIEREDK